MRSYYWTDDQERCYFPPGQVLVLCPTTRGGIAQGYSPGERGSVQRTPPWARLPGVGEPFEVPPGASRPTRRAKDEPGPRRTHPLWIPGYSWGITHGVLDWRWDWHVLDVAPGDLIHVRKYPSGRCWVKRGSVAYVGDLAGAVACMRSRWKGSPPPDWEDMLFPPPPPPPKPTEWVFDGNNGRMMRIEAIHEKYG
jgi:hypothetical protein